MTRDEIIASCARATEAKRDAGARTRAAILEAIRSGATTTPAIARLVGVTPRCVRGHVARLASDGHIRRGRDARCRMSIAGAAIEATPAGTMAARRIAIGSDALEILAALHYGGALTIGEIAEGTGRGSASVELLALCAAGLASQEGCLGPDRPLYVLTAAGRGARRAR